MPSHNLQSYLPTPPSCARPCSALTATTPAPLLLYPSLQPPTPSPDPLHRTSLHPPLHQSPASSPLCINLQLYTVPAFLCTRSLRLYTRSPLLCATHAGNHVPLHARITGNHTPSAPSLRAIMHSSAPCSAPLPPTRCTYSPAPSLHSFYCTTLLRLLHSVPNPVSLLLARYSHVEKTVYTRQIGILRRSFFYVILFLFYYIVWVYIE
ncbi:hypothetical protein SLEP1_g14643 [Rubroshorea leprosula]|uniref:Uncharacterized protein n=1 Tax=Rubroshorea leprosula TaxID=152421 RepID=A0AAV5IUA8_9ROSI|nr:hypothetical protein SLEP1_g14643 [Rubroshorea leprosula]